MTNRELILVRRCAALTLFCESVEQWALKQGSPIAADGGMLAALRKGYIAHVNALNRALAALGLRPTRPDALPSLEQYLAARAGTATTAPASNGQDFPAEKTPSEGRT
jgi:hypothetical protein